MGLQHDDLAAEALFVKSERFGTLAVEVEIRDELHRSCLVAG
jgi:hypothetical protein